MNSIVEEFNEFTWDMVRALPRANYYYTNGIPFSVKCKPGLRSLYQPYTSNIEELEVFEEKNDTATYDYNRPGFTSSKWFPPDLKSYYSSNILSSNKPVVTIQNKYSIEWGREVFNYFDLDSLNQLLEFLTPDYTVVYFRPDGNEKGYYKDQNPLPEFKDYEFISAAFPEVILFKDLLKENKDFNYNTLQFMVEASSEKHITVSGGNACVAAYFGGDVLIYDSPFGAGAGRGIWKTDSWLSLLGDANILGFNDRAELILKIKTLWKY